MGVFLAIATALALSFSGITLEQAENDGIAGSPDVNVADAKMEEALREFDATRSGLGPTLTLGYETTPQGDPPDGTVQQHLGSAGLGITLEDFLTQHLRERESKAGLYGARDDATTAAREERVKVLGLYYDALKARMIWDVRTEVVIRARDIRDAANVRERNTPKEKRIETARADVAVAEAAAAEAEAHGAYDNAIEALRVETGVSPTAFEKTVTGIAPAMDPVLLDPLKASVRALHRRAEVASAEAALEAAKTQRNISRYDAAPAVTLNAGFTTGVDAGVYINGPTAGVALTYPLSGKAGNTIGVQEAKITEASARLAGVERGVVLSVIQASRSVSAAREASIASTRAREAAESELAAARAGYERHSVTSLELITARETYTRALVNEITTGYGLLKAEQTLVLETGK